MPTKKTEIQLAHELVGEEVRRQRRVGESPEIIGIEGHMTLMHDKILRWMRTRDDAEVVGLAADGVFAVSKLIPDLDQFVPEPPNDE